MWSLNHAVCIRGESKLCVPLDDSLLNTRCRPNRLFRYLLPRIGLGGRSTENHTLTCITPTPKEHAQYFLARS